MQVVLAEKSAMHSGEAATSVTYLTICGRRGCLKNKHIAGGMTPVQPSSHSYMHISRNRRVFAADSQSRRVSHAGNTHFVFTHPHTQSHIKCISEVSDKRKKTVGPLYLTSDDSRSTASLF